MRPVLDEIETRVIGCLMEKAVTTPNQYPLTLNALTQAANQKSSREPTMSLSPAVVQRATRGLAERRIVQIEENFKNGVEKYRQRLCGNTGFVDIRLDRAQFAILTLLLLRGPQTPGELRARAGRLHTFADNETVITAARALVDDDDPATGLLVQLPRTKGRREAEFMHQLGGPVDVAALAPEAPAPAGDTQATITQLRQRIVELETDNARLRDLLAEHGLVSDD